jgi:hypothetical protein
MRRTNAPTPVRSRRSLVKGCSLVLTLIIKLDNTYNTPGRMPLRSALECSAHTAHLGRPPACCPYGWLGFPFDCSARKCAFVFRHHTSTPNRAL